MNRPDSKTLLIGLICWMRREGVAATRTRLMKFLYLADLHHARHHGGETVTGWRWRVDAYGPLAEEAYRLFEHGEAEGWLFATCPGERDDERGHKAVFYDVAPGIDVGDALLVVGKVRQWIRELGDHTGTLLRFVYGNTEPMIEASEGDLLDFSTTRPVDNVKPLASRPLSRKDENRFKELSQRLQARYEAARTANRDTPQGPRDAAYLADLPDEDDPMGGDIELLAFSAKRRPAVVVGDHATQLGGLDSGTPRHHEEKRLVLAPIYGLRDPMTIRKGSDPFSRLGHAICSTGNFSRSSIGGRSGEAWMGQRASRKELFDSTDCNLLRHLLPG